MAEPVTPPPEQVAKAKEELKVQGTGGASPLSVVTAATAADNTEKIKQNDAVTYGMSGFWKTPIGIGLSGTILTLLTLITTWATGLIGVSKKDVSSEIAAILSEVEFKVRVIEMPAVKPDTKPVKKYVYQVDTSTDLSILKGLPPGNVEMNDPGSKYQFKEIQYPLPVQVTRVDGVDVEVKKLP